MKDVGLKASAAIANKVPTTALLVLKNFEADFSVPPQSHP